MKTWTQNVDLGKIQSGLHDSILRGGMIAGENILGVSNDHVPHEEGDLERSGAVSSEVGPKSIRIAVTYSDIKAVDQHENMSYKHDAGRTAKYLENAFNSEVKKTAEILANSASEALK